MATYLIANRVPEGFGPSNTAFEAWTGWFGELGSALADRGNPAFAASKVGHCGSDTVLGGYTLVTAPDLAAAEKLCRNHPLLSFGGGIEIAELTLLNEGKRLVADSADTSRVLVTKLLNAKPETVFRCFTDQRRIVGWMGETATVEPEPGGRFHVAMADGFAIQGEFIEVSVPERLSFTYGFGVDAAERVLDDRARQDAAALAPGSTTVTVTLASIPGGTRLVLEHVGLPTHALTAGHQVAWETYLRRLAIGIDGGDPGHDPHNADRDADEVPDLIEDEIVVEADEDTVWKALVAPETWFCDEADLDVRPGATGALTWGLRATGTPQRLPITVETVEAPTVFAFRWLYRESDTPAPGNSLLVRFTISPDVAGARVRVGVHGFTDVDWPLEKKIELATQQRNGWPAHLRRLRQVLSSH
ncbi:SRPBCC domain-containing protein [Nocardia sp. NPDC050793]|uniref:SRPBCC domain-containing protein n=1 Tax=Nocardia sp. NPDC050793 TaxID=3155159 RepID=UPI0033D2110D